MPRLIDHALRRAELAEAVWRVVGRDGVGAVSVRNVAAEAGVSAGSLRHVLSTKEAMLVAAVELVVERGTERFRARAESTPVRGRADAIAWLAELLPLDDVRRLELRTHLALMLESSGYPALAAPRQELDDAVRAGCHSVLAACAEAQLLRPGLDLADEAARLHVLVDGLALHLLGPGQPITAGRAEQLLDDHLAARWRA